MRTSYGKRNHAGHDCFCEARERVPHDLKPPRRSARLLTCLLTDRKVARASQSSPHERKSPQP